jgi:tetraacyldisaccharide 4'-kinase
MNIMRAALARRLESGLGLPGSAFLTPLWGALSASRVRRPLTLPPRTRIIGIGGATLGGSGKTPFSIALARKIAARGERVVLVGHGYMASPGFARVVRPEDDVREVGDEALWAARALDPVGVEVVVAPSRQAAVDFAATRARRLVVDGLLQARPRRVARSMLIVDGCRPWGSGDVPPAGDLRAPPAALLEAADTLVSMEDGDEAEIAASVVSDGRHVFHVSTKIGRALAADGSALPIAALMNLRVGILLGIARPDRILRALERRGIRPRVVMTFADHAVPGPAILQGAADAARARRVEVWLCTQKCMTKLPGAIAGLRVHGLVQELDPSDALVDAALG